jgi:sugar/nucleoside kinase (ribokinase family)
MSARTSFDVVGLGLNATDTLIRLPCFPAPDSKMELLSADVRAGGQVASAMVACRKWGLRTTYIGKVGDDAAAQLQQEELERAGVVAHLLRVSDCSSQIAFVLVDDSSGERTILSKRDSRLTIAPQEILREWFAGARALLVDGHDVDAAIQAARWAREMRIPVVADIDNRYSQVEVLLEVVDYLFTSSDFPARLTDQPDILKSLPEISRRFKCRLSGATLGRLGAVAWDGVRFHYCPGFRVKAVDTTGAGDIFHAGFVYGLLGGWALPRILKFSCAAAALNCTAVGARAGIATVEQIEHLMSTAERSEPAYDKPRLEASLRRAKS